MPPLPARADLAAIVHRSLLVGAELTDRLLRLPDDSPRNPATDYHFLSRAMRQSILLLERFADVAETPKPPEDPAIRRAAIRERVIRSVEDAIHQHAAGRDPDALRAELLERLADENLLRQLDARPTSEIVAGLCRDLHLLRPSQCRGVKRRTPADIAALRAAVTALPATAPAPAPTPQPAPPPLAPPPAAPRARPPALRRPLSTPSLILPPGAERQAPPDRPEADSRDLR